MVRPLQMIAPILDDIAAEFEGRLKVVKLNIDDNEATPAKFGVRGIPTLMVFKKWRKRCHQSRRFGKRSIDRICKRFFGLSFNNAKGRLKMFRRPFCMFGF